MSATGRGAIRAPRDSYSTPIEALEALSDLLPELYTGGAVLEPGIGSGVVIQWLRRKVEHLGPVCGVELPEALEDDGDPDRDLLEAQGVQVVPADFLTWPGPPHARFRLVIGNPPYSHAQAFVDRSLELLEAGGALVFLLRLGFLGAQKRRAWWASSPLAHVRVLSKRPAFSGRRSTDACEYAWFVWRPGSAGPATLDVR